MSFFSNLFKTKVVPTKPNTIDDSLSSRILERGTPLTEEEKKMIENFKINRTLESFICLVLHFKLVDEWTMFQFLHLVESKESQGNLGKKENYFLLQLYGSVSVVDFKDRNMSFFDLILRRRDCSFGIVFPRNYILMLCSLSEDSFLRHKKALAQILIK